MANTTNFGWETPDDTDLVKDGALAMRTLGNAIDTSLVDLKGGTTGQVLSKTSNTDMDFSWVTSDDANAIQNAIVDAKGDLITATAADTPARLAVGSNGDTLVADSATSTGLRYQPKAATNYALNSDFSIWQRGTSISPTSNGGAYTADRWYGTRGSNTSLTVSRETAGNLSTSPNQAFRYCARVLRTAGSTTTSAVDFGQMFETTQSVPLAGQTVTLSAWIRKGANFSATSDSLSMIIIEGTGTDQKQMDGGYTGSNTVVSTAKTLTSSWQRFSVTGTLATSATEITIKFSYTPTGTAGAADYFEVTGVQLELGSVATAWNYAGGTLQGELAACQRYYWRTTSGTTYGYVGADGFIYTATNFQAKAQFPVTMRIAPTSIDFSNIAVQDASAAILAITAVTNDTSVTSPTGAGFAATIAGGTTLRYGRILSNNNNAGYLGFSAEL